MASVSWLPTTPSLASHCCFGSCTLSAFPFRISCIVCGNSLVHQLFRLCGEVCDWPSFSYVHLLRLQKLRPSVSHICTGDSTSRARFISRSLSFIGLRGGGQQQAPTTKTAHRHRHTSTETGREKNGINTYRLARVASGLLFFSFFPCEAGTAR